MSGPANEPPNWLRLHGYSFKKSLPLTQIAAAKGKFALLLKFLALELAG
jgi:hypothetical protein